MAADKENTSSFSVGDLFKTYEELEEKVKVFEQVYSIQLWKREARTVASARKRVDRYLKPELKYYQIKYCCIHGGKTFKSDGKGVRKNTMTYKRECPMHISLCIDESGHHLQVTSASFEHNHPVSQELFRHLPKQRRLPTALKEQASALLAMNANKKIVQAKMMEASGKVVLLKDLSNIKADSCKGKSRNDVDSVVKTLMDKYNSTVDVLSDEDSNFMGIFFQDVYMTSAFNSYPEILFIDATYKLLELGIPTYLMLSEDSNGNSCVVSVCLLVSEDHDSMLWMINTFKKRNPRWNEVRVVMADKDILERDVIKAALPTASVLICLFHVLRSFRREISCDKLGITSGQRMVSLELVQKLAYASSEQEYEKLHEELRQCSPKVVSKYFDENWHPLRHEWVLHFKAISGSYLNSTNNRLESINCKLKQVINRHSSLEDFITQLFIILSALRSQCDHKAAVFFQKVRVVPFGKGSAESQYSELLTSYASAYVSKQLALGYKIKAEKMKQCAYSPDSYEVQTTEGVKIVSSLDCECIFRRSMMLPCRHIFALRMKLNLPLFFPQLCNPRWTSEYYYESQKSLFTISSSSSSVEVTHVEPAAPDRALSQHQKFRKAICLTSELASIVSEYSGVHYCSKIKLLKDLIGYWKSGQEMALVTVDEVSDYSDNCASENDTCQDNTNGVFSQQLSPLQEDECSTNQRSLQVFDSSSSAAIHLDACSVSRDTSQEPAISLIGETSQETMPVTAKRPCLSEDSEDFQSLCLKVPPVVKRRGRPKGHALTVCGLPVKRKKRPSCFSLKHYTEKEKIILSWFVEPTVINSAMDGKLIEEETVECRPEVIPSSVLDENVDINLVRKYFSHDAWLVVEDVVKRKRDLDLWICSVCQDELHGNTIACESCLLWFHFACVGVLTQPKCKNWFCRQCSAKI